MSWLFSRALAAASSADASWAGEPSVPSNSTPMPHAFLSHGRTTAYSRLSRFGMTFAPLTESHGAALLMWSLAASRARTSASPARASVSRAPAAASGPTWRGSLARFDPDTHSWRTSQRSLFADSSESWVTWPASGMTAAGQCWELPTLAHPISGTVFGFSVPTPVASDGTTGALIGEQDEFYTTATGLPRKINRNGTDGSVGLARLVRMWPTPAATLGTKAGRVTRRKAREGGTLIEAISARKRWPTPHGFSPDGRSNGPSGNELGRAVNRRFRTPMASDGKTSQRETLADRMAKRQQIRLSHQVAVGGSLNPMWVEWLMGWPLGWTGFEPLATDRSRSARQPHGGSLPPVSMQRPAPFINPMPH